MATLEQCRGCGVSFKHHELVLHRKVKKCGIDYPLRCTVIKDALHKQKRHRIKLKRL